MSDLPRSIGRYAVDKLLGRGSMGVVYKGHDPDIDRAVAIKLVRVDLLGTIQREDYLARFRLEVQAAGRCMHPNIVATYDFGSHEGNPFFVMEYVSGAPLDEILQRGVGLGAKSATEIIVQVLDALTCAHGLGVVHRDIKPSNILLTQDRQIKVMDFGVSRIDTSHLTQAGAIMGTPRYMSPEQFRGEAVDARSDLFSTGILLHELLTGALPIDGRTVEEIMVKLLYEDLVLAPANALLPEPFRQVVAKALARSPDNRFPSADAMSAALKAALSATDHPENVSNASVEAGTVFRAAPSRNPAPGPGPDDVRLAPLGGGTGADASWRHAPGYSTGEISPCAFADAATLQTLEKHLAHYVGPMAGRMLRRAVSTATSPEGLCLALGAHIEAEQERTKFILESQAALSNGAPRSGAESVIKASSSTHAASSLTQTEIEHVQNELTRFLGPFARVLVKRAAPGARSAAELRERLSQHLDHPNERAAFLTGR